MKKKSVSLEKTMSLKDVVAFLEDLVAGFKAGKIVVEQGDQYVCLNPPEFIEVEVGARQKKDKEKISLELGWRIVGCEKDDDPRLKISTQEPEPVETTEDSEKDE